MQIVLLSGGSGKRLWPLSNNARSKQFLPLLEKEDGTMESMVQRVVRQAREAHLTDELRRPVIGNAVMGPRCSNTNVINELQYPIYVDGMEDAVIAASPDGIIVCRKKYTEDIKKAVDNLTPRPMYEERRWGTYRVIDSSKPDGTMRKLIDVSKLHSLGWTHKVEIEDGVRKLFDWYRGSLK